MGSGGARSRSGPPPERGALRDKGGWIHLSSDREGDPPPWPLPGRATKFELERWVIEWRRPQATMWERLGWEVQVAVYIRTLRRSVEPRAAAGLTKNVQTQMDNLGLTKAGADRNRWIIDDHPAEAAPRRRPPTSTAKDRLSVLQGGADDRAS